MLLRSQLKGILLTANARLTDIHFDGLFSLRCLCISSCIYSFISYSRAKNVLYSGLALYPPLVYSHRFCIATAFLSFHLLLFIISWIGMNIVP